jgi:hypothetical protein
MSNNSCNICIMVAIRKWLVGPELSLKKGAIFMMDAPIKEVRTRMIGISSTSLGQLPFQVPVRQ